MGKNQGGNRIDAVVDAEAEIVKVENYLRATSLLAQTTVRSVIGQSELDDQLTHRDTINQTAGPGRRNG